METNKKDPNGLKDQKDKSTGNSYSNSTSNLTNNRNESSIEKGSADDRGKTDGKSGRNPKDSGVQNEQRDQRTETTPGARGNSGTPTGMSNSSIEKEPVDHGKAGGDKDKNQMDLFKQKDQKEQRTGSSNTISGKGMGNTRNESLDKGTADRGSKPGVDKDVSSRDKADTTGRK